MINIITSKIACMALLLVASASALAQTTQKRLALLIGNSAYQNIAPLSSPNNDVDAMESLLISAGFEVIKVKDATKKVIKENAGIFSERLKDYDVGMFYYSGHGLEVDGTNYIVPIDLPKLTSNINKLDIEDGCVKTDYINGKMSNAGTVNKTYILVLDACRNSPFKGFKDIVEQDGWASPRDIPAGSIVCYAASVGQRAVDGSIGQNSPYTTYFIKHAQTKDIKIEDVFKRVRIELQVTETQVPQELSSLNADFYFFKSPLTSSNALLVNQDHDGDGVKDTDDACPDVFGTNEGCPVLNGVEGDYDGDAVKDKDDDCPSDYGTANGCPDADADQVPDKIDQCKYERGEPRWQGCPDTDKDGIPDHQDACPKEYGQLADKGCPLIDSDKDGVPDKSDRCATAYGLKQYQGCPDTDGDGIPDIEDDCPKEKGLATKKGCPEADYTETGITPSFKMIAIPTGQFTMGCTSEQQDCEDNEKPTHQVTLSSFYMSETEVTQAQ